MNNNRMQLHLNILLRLATFAVCVLALVYVVPPALSLLAPFIVAIVVAAALNPLVTLLQKKLHIPRRILALLLTILLFCGFAYLSGWFVYSLSREIVSIATNTDMIREYSITSWSALFPKLQWLFNIIPGEQEAQIALAIDGIISWIQNSANAIADGFLTVPTKVYSGVVSVLFFIIATYFIIADFPNISAKTNSPRFLMVKRASKTAVGGYLKAQLILALIAWATMFIALLIYRQPYAFLLAILLAFVDFLPFLGTAIILVPWATCCLIAGDIGKTIFLLALSNGFFVIRKMLEPKIVSDHMNLSPLITLISLYVGLKFIGVWGAIAAPIVVMTLISLNGTGFFDFAKKEVRGFFEDLQKLFGGG